MGLGYRPGFNPYFIGLPILIRYIKSCKKFHPMFHILFYWITYSYYFLRFRYNYLTDCFNPYFIGLPILILFLPLPYPQLSQRFNPYFIGLPILISLKVKIQEFLQ